jgi:carboxyl-terminal processing protease
MYIKQLMNYVDETNPAELMDNAIEECCLILDPYTTFWTEQEVERAKTPVASLHRNRSKRKHTSR